MDKVFYIQKDNIYIVPVCHYRAEFALEVKKTFIEVKPHIVAVELPSTLDKYIKEAVGRFPFLSVIFYKNGQGDYIYFPIEPTDPLAEGIRLGLESGIPVHCIDLDTDSYPLLYDPMPDSYAIFRIGLEEYYNAYRDIVGNSPYPLWRLPHDEMRERNMAHYLQKLSQQNKKILFICGMSHVLPILELLKEPCPRPLGKVVRENIRIFNLSMDSVREVSAEIPFLMSIYEMIRGNYDIEKEVNKVHINERIKRDQGEKVVSLADKMRKRRKEEEEINQKVMISEEGIKKKGINTGDDGRKGLGTGIKGREMAEEEPGYNGNVIQFPGEDPFLSHSTEVDRFDSLYEPSPRESYSPAYFKALESQQEARSFQNFVKDIFKKLFQLKEQKKEINPYNIEKEKLDFEEWLATPRYNPYIKREQVHKFKTSEDRTEELLRYFHNLRGFLETGNKGFDRQIIILELIKQCAKYYHENVNEEIKYWQILNFMKFARKYSAVTGSLMPDIYQLIICARGCADDNFAYEVWDLGTYYPWIDDSGKYQTVDIHADEVWLAGRKITLRRRFPYLRKTLMRIPVKDRKKEKKPGDWAKKFKGDSICSYPPEDIVIENYGTYLRKKGMNILSEEKSRIVPFTTSLLDGIDMRETIRNWHEQKLYVKDHSKISGGVGSVVVIFDEDPHDKNFPWKMTWQGEHHQESDMALYSTIPGEKIVGPGIARAEYGGFMMTYPPMRVWDVWTDSFYSSARSKSEILLMSAIEYSLEKHVAYISAKPPRSFFTSFASRLNKKIIYIPIGQLSPVTIKKIRVFHVLSGHSIREIAKDYIW